MFANLKLVLRSYTSLYGIFMSASLTLFYFDFKLFVFVDSGSVYIVLENSK